MSEAQRRLLVLCPFPQGVAAGQRLKYEQYFDDWRAHGYDVTVSSYMDEGMWKVVYTRGHYAAKIAGVLRGQVRRLMDLRRVAGFDLVYVFMYVTPLGSTWFERAVRARGRRVVFDVEDNVLTEQGLPTAENPNPIMRFLKGSGKAHYLIAQADHVITSSTFLNDYCLKLNRARACTYITSSVDAGRYVPAHRYSNAEGKVVIGWTGTFSSKVYLDLLRPVFQRLAKTHAFKLLVIGNFEYALEGVDLEVVQWTKEREIEDLQRFDIGVYPLPIDDWVLGKSGLKAIQYMAMALPAVSTRVGSAPLIIDDGREGLLVETEDEWVEKLAFLIDRPDERRRIGLNARRKVEGMFSKAVVGKQYLAVLDSAMETKPGVAGIYANQQASAST